MSEKYQSPSYENSVLMREFDSDLFEMELKLGLDSLQKRLYELEESQAVSQKTLRELVFDI